MKHHHSPSVPPTAKLRAAAIDVGHFATKYTSGRKPGNGAAGAIVTGSFPSGAPIHHEVYNRKTGPAGVVPFVIDGVQHLVPVGLKDHGTEADSYGAKRVSERYSRSTAHRALFRAALYKIAGDNSAAGDMTIDSLVAGLPIAGLFEYRDELTAFIKEPHVIPHPTDEDRTITVSVKDVSILGQPQGALMNHFMSKGTAIPGETNLVLDMGGGTLDWLVAKELKASKVRSGSHTIGAWECAIAVCKRIDPKLVRSTAVLARIDEALRTKAPTVRIQGAEISLAPHLKTVHTLLSTAWDRMEDGVKMFDDLESIIFAGGGAALLHESAKQVAPHLARMFVVAPESTFSNVRGFHLWAEDRLRQTEAV